MTVQINGKERTFDTPVSIQHCVAEYLERHRDIVVELNEEIVRKDAWEKTSLKDGDVLEVIGFVGGG